MADLNVPYVDLVMQHAPLKAELLEAAGRVIDEGQFILGSQVDEFERHFADLCGTRLAIGVNSGTDALLLALRALEVGPDDEVITVPNTFIATVAAIRLCGARAVLVDVNEDGNLDPTKLARAITPRTKVLLPVHLTGRPCDMDGILTVARARGLHVVEDCAQAVLAESRGQRVGSLGILGCFSLHPLKTLNACGDGGALTTNDPALAERLKILRNIGLKQREDCVVFSGNSRLDTIQAAFLLVKLRHLEAWTHKRRANAKYFQTQLDGIAGVQVPVEREGQRCVYHTFVIQADRRDELQEYLKVKGIATVISYPVPIHLQTAGRELGYSPGSFPAAERQAQRILSLPIYPELTEQQLAYVVASVREFYDRGARP
jgi:dTDP-4-amino-4,6-dideoxygalactose transaminase